MQIPLGVATERSGVHTTVVFDTQRAINGHGLFCGMSGTGKTHRVRKVIQEFIKSAVALGRKCRIHIIDVHEDIDVPGSSDVQFSQSTPWGFNPLEINPDPHFGGIDRAIQQFIESVKRQKTLGTKQEAVLRYLLEDLYAQRGFLQKDPSSWYPDDPREMAAKLAGKEDRIFLDVGYEQRVRFKELARDSAGRPVGDWDKELKSWFIRKEYYAGDILMWSRKNVFKTVPTLDDLVDFCEQKLKALFLGGNGAAVTLLNNHNRNAALFHRKAMDLNKRGESMDKGDYDAEMVKLEEKRGQAVASYESFLVSVTTGRELHEVLRYNSVDVLKSVYERLQNLRSVGIFRSEVPPFDPYSPIWRYKMKAVGIPEQRMFVEVTARRIFQRAMQRGEQSDVVEVLLIEEASRFAYDDHDNILNIISLEGRKFGLALWCVAQSPEAFSDGFLKSVALKVVLGVAPADEKVTSTKLGFDVALHKKVIPRKVGLVQVINSGEIPQPFAAAEMN